MKKKILLGIAAVFVLGGVGTFVAIRKNDVVQMRLAEREVVHEYQDMMKQMRTEASRSEHPIEKEIYITNLKGEGYEGVIKVTKTLKPEIYKAGAVVKVNGNVVFNEKSDNYSRVTVLRQYRELVPYLTDDAPNHYYEIDLKVAGVAPPELAKIEEALKSGEEEKVIWALDAANELTPKTAAKLLPYLLFSDKNPKIAVRLGHVLSHIGAEGIDFYKRTMPEATPAQSALIFNALIDTGREAWPTILEFSEKYKYSPYFVTIIGQGIGFKADAYPQEEAIALLLSWANDPKIKSTNGIYQSLRAYGVATPEIMQALFSGLEVKPYKGSYLIRATAATSIRLLAGVVPENWKPSIIKRLQYYYDRDKLLKVDDYQAKNFGDVYGETLQAYGVTPHDFYQKAEALLKSNDAMERIKAASRLLKAGNHDVAKAEVIHQFEQGVLPSGNLGEFLYDLGTKSEYFVPYLVKQISSGDERWVRECLIAVSILSEPRRHTVGATKYNDKNWEKFQSVLMPLFGVAEKHLNNSNFFIKYKAAQIVYQHNPTHVEAKEILTQCANGPDSMFKAKCQEILKGA